MRIRSIVISGATSGMGRALLEFYATRGHTVAACGRNTKALDEMRSKYPQVRFSAVDVVDSEAVRRWSEELHHSMKAVDLVVACAGVAPENGDPSNPKVLWELSSQDFDDTIDVNVKGARQ